jgi:FrmR/RcnR family transcriptional regulator, repressor of frmRAB operon
VAHTIRNKQKLISRVRRIRGQVEAIERALASEGDCGDTLRLIAAARGAMNALMAEVMEGHVRFHVLNSPPSKSANAAEEMIEVIRAYLK